MILTGAHPKDLWPGVKMHFGHVYDEHVEEWSQIFDRETSDKAYEEYPQYRGLGLAPVKAQSQSIQFQDTQQGYISRIVNVVYALGAVVSREAIEDGQYESIAMRLAKHIAFSLRQTQEHVGANVLNRFTTSGYNGGDGVPLGSASHPEANGNQSNILSVAADFSEQALEDLLIMIMNATDSNGLKISLIGKKLILPTALSFEGERVVNSIQRSGTSNNDTNAIRSLGLLPDGIAVNHYLSDPDQWIVKTNAPEGLICQMRRDKEFGQDNDFDTENAKMKGSIRFGFGWADWRAVYGSPGA